MAALKEPLARHVLARVVSREELHGVQHGGARRALCSAADLAPRARLVQRLRGRGRGRARARARARA